MKRQPNDWVVVAEVPCLRVEIDVVADLVTSLGELPEVCSVMPLDVDVGGSTRPECLACCGNAIDPVHFAGVLRGLDSIDWLTLAFGDLAVGSSDPAVDRSEHFYRGSYADSLRRSRVMLRVEDSAHLILLFPHEELEPVTIMPARLFADASVRRLPIAEIVWAS